MTYTPLYFLSVIIFHVTTMYQSYTTTCGSAGHNCENGGAKTKPINHSSRFFCSTSTTIFIYHGLKLLSFLMLEKCVRTFIKSTWGTKNKNKKKRILWGLNALLLFSGFIPLWKWSTYSSGSYRQSRGLLLYFLLKMKVNLIILKLHHSP